MYRLSELRHAWLPKREAEAAADPAKLAWQSAKELYLAAAAQSAEAKAAETPKSIAAWDQFLTYCDARDVDLPKMLSCKVGRDYPLRFLVDAKHVETTVALSRGLHTAVLANDRGVQNATKRYMRIAGCTFMVTDISHGEGGTSKLISQRKCWPCLHVAVNHGEVPKAADVRMAGAALPIAYWYEYANYHIISLNAEFDIYGQDFKLVSSGRYWKSNCVVLLGACENEKQVSYSGSLCGDWTYLYLATGLLSLPGKGEARGDFSSNEGKGQITHPDGRWYEGDWKVSSAWELPTPHGKGQMKRPLSDTVDVGGTELYVGAFNNGKPHGMGFFSSDGQSVYQGQWSHGRRCGDGKSREFDDTIIVGSFLDDVPSGICSVGTCQSSKMPAEAFSPISDQARITFTENSPLVKVDEIAQALDSLQETWPPPPNVRRVVFANREPLSTSSHTTDLATANAPIRKLEKALEQSQAALAAAMLGDNP